MFQNNTGTLDRIYDTLGADAASGLRALGNCSLPLTHRAPISIITSARLNARTAALTVVRYPIPPETYATLNPSNGLALDVWGKARFRGHVQFDQGVVLDFEGLLALFPVGFQMPWHDETDIPDGWAIMDGVSNASGSGIDRGGRVGYGYIAGDPTFGTLGGSVALAFTATLLGNGGSTAVSIDGHTGAGSANTGTQALAFDPTPIAEDFQAGASFTLYAFTSSPVITPDPHSHTISGSAIAALIGNHSATVSNNTLAGNITIDTPTVLRPAGVVELWIEKLP